MPLDVLQPETIRGLANALREEDSDLSYTDAVRIWDTLAPLREKMGALNDSELLADANEILMRVFSLALPVASDADVQRFLAEYITYLLDRDDVDLEDTMRRKLLTKEFIEDRNDYRQKIRTIMLDSRIPLAGTAVFGAIGNSVGECLRAYLAKNPGNNSLAQAELMSIVQADVRLSEQEKKRIKRLVTFFDYLRLSSAAEGFEEQIIFDIDGTPMQFQGGRAVEAGSSQNPLEQKVLQGFSVVDATEAGQPGILEKQATQYRLEHPTDLSVDEYLLEQIAFGEAKNITPPQVCAALLRVCLETSLRNAIEVTGCVSLRDLFETILVRGADISLDNAAAIAGRLVAKLAPEERRIHAREVYYDMEAGKFVWGDPVIVPVE